MKVSNEPWPLGFIGHVVEGEGVLTDFMKYSQLVEYKSDNPIFVSKTYHFCGHH
jgi:hypothetical protein